LNIVLGLPIAILPSGCPAKLYAPLLFAIHATCPACLILDLITKLYLVRSTEYEASQYVVICTPLLPHPSYT
jgi:hypothetical protein